ncbi:MAG: hypothetical protein AAF718_14675 [Pseudomonadota bacterium]
MIYTRRDIAKLALSSAALAAVPLVAQAQEDWGPRLETRLNALIQDAAFKVTNLTQSDGKTTAHLTLTWPPGQRRRQIEAAGRYEALETASIETFADVLDIGVT